MDDTQILVHLEECSPAQHEAWEKMSYREALALAGQMCPDTAYMVNELFPDETVWVERVAKPAPITVSVVLHLYNGAINPLDGVSVEDVGWLIAAYAAGTDELVLIGRNGVTTRYMASDVTSVEISRAPSAVPSNLNQPRTE